MDAASLTAAFRGVVQLLDPDATLLDQRRLKGGVSADIHALKIGLPGGTVREVVVRRHGGAEWKSQTSDVATTEYSLLTELFRVGIPVPEPLLIDSSAELLPSPYLVMEMVAGTTRVEPDDLDGALKQMAGFLKALHGLPLAQLDVALLPAREDPIAGALKYLPAGPEYSAARTVIGRWQLSPRTDALLHGDFWPGNVLWNNGELAAVIDWEDAATGDALSDVACCRCELMVMYGEQAMQTFTRHYFAEASLNVADLLLWEVYVSSSALATMADWGLAPEEEAARRKQTEAFFDSAIRALLAADVERSG